MKKLVAITGASSGIGLACAKLFSEQGYPVLIMARRKEILDNLNLDNCVTARVDVRDIDQIKNAIKLAEEKFGPVDLMINNAGIMPMDKYADQDLQEKYDTLDINIKGVINGMDAVLPTMRKLNHGTIINISSVSGRYTSVDHAVYNGSKFAVNAITEQSRRELSDTNIRFCLIEPAIVDTNLLSTTTNKEVLEIHMKRKNKLNGGLSADQIAQTILYVYQLPQDVSIKELMISHTNQAV
ncbi:Oxidoreductase, short chain dehydrogenase-reductase family [Mycoplasma yeatsii 13926]|uniref:Oxidoreductase, short chain dehydrogenase-reductase family n=1 Tax=Mycoplasma yeatsii 13926 TaxID=1188240 RepID=S6G8Z9_9MOLU|nr:SDR family oxidoreductase [Mycoplasma yeatsii]EOA07420.1 Oxidoreductase, short chain dehydrogenase-reductase family [Mycoplasma yeatsii 13926]